MSDEREQSIEEEILEALGQEDPDLIAIIETMTEGKVEYWLRFAEKARLLENGRVRAWAMLAAMDAGYTSGLRGRELDDLLEEASVLVHTHLSGTTYEETIAVAELRKLRDTRDARIVEKAEALRRRYRGYGFFAACTMHGEHALAHGDTGLALDLLASSMRAEPDMLLSVRGLMDTRLDVALEEAGVGTKEVEAFRTWIRTIAWEKVVR